MNMKQWLNSVKESEIKKAFPILSFPSISLMGITVKELINNSDLQAEGMKRIADRADTLASVGMMDLSLEAEAFGSNIHVSDGEVPTVVGAIVTSEEEAQNLKVPSVDSGRCALYINAIKKASELICDRPVFAGVIGPYSLAGRLMDVTEIMINCYTNPEFVHTVMKKTTEFIINYANAYKERTGAKGVLMAEPLTGMLSPELAEEFSSPYVKQIVDAVQDDDFLVLYHNCGNNTVQMIDSLLSIGASAYHFGNSVNMKDVLEKVPSDVIVMGNVDPARQFRNGTVESIKEETNKVMNECCGYKNFIISSGCDIPPASNWDNIDAFFDAVKEFYNK